MVADIAVIGAGAAGLVTARHLLRCGLRPTILEASNDVGGMWTTCSSSYDFQQQEHQQKLYQKQLERDVNNHNRKTWNDMRTNLSRYTCCFSDYPWSTAFPQEFEKESAQEDAQSFFFPTTHEMHEYLKSYTNHFLTSNDDCIFQLGCQVTRIFPAPENRYCVEWKNVDTAISDNNLMGTSLTEQRQRIFDGVVVASGFFSNPAWPDNVDLSSFRGRHIHSSQYRSKKQLGLDNTDNRATTKTIAICGSSFSALEIASNLGGTLSFTPEKVLPEEHKVVIQHIAPTMPWVIPRFIPSPEEKPVGYIPLDIALYRRVNDGLKKEVFWGNNEKQNTKKHNFLERLLGTRKQSQCLANQNIQQPFDDTTLPVYTSISNEYLDLVGNGRIHVIPGRLVGCDDQGSLQVEKTISKGTNTSCLQALSDVDVLISCTGFRTNLEFLDYETILQTIEYEPNNKFVPIILCDDVYHPELKSLAFVGMYRGPYFGVMELQAQLAAAKIAIQLNQIGVQSSRSTKQEQVQDMIALDIARNIRKQIPKPQLPRSDYIGRMDSLVTRIKQLPFNNLGDAPFFTEKGQIVIPAMYQSDHHLAESQRIELTENLHKHCRNSKTFHQFLLQSLLGKWTFDRTLTQLSDDSSQYVGGSIEFSIQHDQETNTDFILYREDGVMEITGRSIDVFREYHYLTNPQDGALEIFFVESGRRAHLFLRLLFDYDSTRDSWVASSDHLCIKDLYDARFQIELHGLAANRVEMKYKVKGPSKAYEALTILKPYP